MTETPDLTRRLRARAHELEGLYGAGDSAPLLTAAADALEQASETTAKYDVLVASIEALRDMVLKEHAAAEQAEAARRAFLERAVCHPGPPASEHEGYDPEAPLGELETAVLERMDLELVAGREVHAWRSWGAQWMRWPSAPTSEDRKLGSDNIRDALAERIMREMRLEKMLDEVRGVLEEAIGRTPDPARSVVQVARDLLVWTRTMGLSPPTQPGDIGSIEHSGGRTTYREGHPIVRPEHFAGPFPAISGYVKRTQEARAAVVDQALGMLGDSQRLAVHDEPERVDILFLDPGQDPPRGQTWAVYGPLSAKYREALKASLDRERRARAGRPASTTGSEVHQDAVAAHIKAHGGDPAAATVAQIANAMDAVDPNATYKPNAAGNGLDWSPVQRAGVGGSIRIVGGDPEAIAALGLEERGCHEHCLAEPRCRNRAEMRAAHGTPAEFAAAVERAAPEMLASEVSRTVAEYRAVWDAATEPDADTLQALNSDLAAMGCDPATATQAEFKRSLWAVMQTKAVAAQYYADKPREVIEPQHPKAAEFQKLVDDLRAKHAGALNDPATRRRIQGDIAGFMASLKGAPAPVVVRVSPELAAAVERQREEDAAARQRTLMETRRSQTYRPGPPTPPADYPAEYMTREEAAAEQAERFQGLDDSDRD